MGETGMRKESEKGGAQKLKERDHGSYLRSYRAWESAYLGRGKTTTDLQKAPKEKK